MGMNGAPFGPIGMKPGPGCRTFRDASFGKGARGPGAGALGTSWKMLHFLQFCLTFVFTVSKQNGKHHEIDQICSDWPLIGAP